VLHLLCQRCGDYEQSANGDGFVSGRSRPAWIPRVPDRVND